MFEACRIFCLVPVLFFSSVRCLSVRSLRALSYNIASDLGRRILALNADTKVKGMLKASH